MNNAEAYNFNLVVGCVKHSTGVDLNLLAASIGGRNVGLKEKLRTQEKALNAQSMTILKMYETITKLEGEIKNVSSGKI